MTYYISPAVGYASSQVPSTRYSILRVEVVDVAKVRIIIVVIVVSIYLSKQ